MHEASTEHSTLIEEKGIDTVTVQEAHGSPRTVFSLWMAANIGFGTLTTGALSTGAFGLSAPEAFASILIANLVGAILLGVFSTFGVEYGLPQMIQGSHWFGRVGNKLPSLLNCFSGFSWFAVNTIIGAYALQYFLGSGLIISVLGLAVIQIAIAFFGHDLIQTAEKYLVYVLVLVFLMLSVVAVRHLGLYVPANVKSMTAVGGFTGAFMLSTSVVIGVVASWVPYSSDYTRYFRTDKNQTVVKRRVMTNAFWGTLISMVWIECLGALIGASVSFSKPSDLFTDWMPVWLRIPLLVAAIFGTITANILNIYSATLSALALGVKLKQHQAALLTGAIGTAISVLAATNFISNFTNFLFLLGYWVMPWISTTLLCHFTSRLGRFKSLSPALASFVATLVLSVPFYDQTMYTGWFATKYPQFGDCTFMVSFVIAGVLYMLFTVPQPAMLTAAAE